MADGCRNCEWLFPVDASGKPHMLARSTYQCLAPVRSEADSFNLSYGFFAG